MRRICSTRVCFGFTVHSHIPLGSSTRKRNIHLNSKWQCLRAGINRFLSPIAEKQYFHCPSSILQSACCRMHHWVCRAVELDLFDQFSDPSCNPITSWQNVEFRVLIILRNYCNFHEDINKSSKDWWSNLWAPKYFPLSFSLSTLSMIIGSIIL